MDSRPLPSPDSLRARYDASDAMRDYVAHNLRYWRQTHGGLALAEQFRIDFDPIAQYWMRAEARLIVSFFVDRFRESYAPADELRTLAFRVFRHFGEARTAGRFGEPRVIYSESAGDPDWPNFVDRMRPVANELPDMPEYAALRAVWARQLKNGSIRDELNAYLDEASKAKTIRATEESFYRRIAWFPYLGLSSLDELAPRQLFFAGYYQAMTSTNSYAMGGSISFAPVVQNNPSGVLLNYLRQWTEGKTPFETKFIVEGKTETKDRCEHAPVIELFCLLNLHRAPILNSRSDDVLARFAQPGDVSPYDRILRAGQATRAMLNERKQDQQELARSFLRFLESPSAPVLAMEGIRLQPVAAKRPDDVAKQIDLRLHASIDEEARKRATTLDELDRATIMYHLLLDGMIYEDQQQLKPDLSPPPPKPSKPIETGYNVRGLVEAGGTSVISEPKGPKVQLPESLARVANDALGFLRAGSHVLLAGPPGTGKTTVAQFVGHAWKTSSVTVSTEIFVADAPITTVATSAWSPFHTTGGLFPTADNRVAPMPGVFIETDAEHKNEWRLRGECIVLDEMNRADLDRCIGELYPLLSGSVARVRPAGLPGIDWIVANERFRIVATVNDASLDDVVFPISEGLARRFVRLELFGATLEALKTLFARGKPDAARMQAALSVVDQLFAVCKDQKLLKRTDEGGDHLPFGVGYFSMVHRWVTGDLKLSQQFQEEDIDDQAAEIVRTSLASVVRVRGLAAILEGLASGAD